MSKPINEILKPIEWLAGRWSTKNGMGKYPTIKNFSYHDTIEFKCIGQPMFNFLSLSTHPEKNTPMHQERGFLRIRPGTNEVALVVSHNFGLTTVEEGTVDIHNKEMKLKSVSISRMSFATSPHVMCLERCIKLVEPGKLLMVIQMETENTQMTEHLRAVYTQEEDY